MILQSVDLTDVKDALTAWAGLEGANIGTSIDKDLVFTEAHSIIHDHMPTFIGAFNETLAAYTSAKNFLPISDLHDILVISSYPNVKYTEEKKNLVSVKDLVVTKPSYNQVAFILEGYQVIKKKLNPSVEEINDLANEVEINQRLVMFTLDTNVQNVNITNTSTFEYLFATGNSAGSAGMPTTVWFFQHNKLYSSGSDAIVAGVKMANCFLLGTFTGKNQSSFGSFYVAEPFLWANEANIVDYIPVDQFYVKITCSIMTNGLIGESIVYSRI